MTDYTKLVEALRGKFIAYDVTGNHNSAQLYKDAADAIEALQAAPRWHRVEEPPQSGQECFTAYRSILRSEPEWLYDICYYTDDLARDCLLMDGAEHRSGWYRYESEYGDVECHPKYWMPIVPPKEEV